MNAAPPRWMSNTAGILLPPSRREQVLGDLEERYRAADQARARWQYLLDALLVVPAVVWTERRRWHISSDAPARLRLSSGPGTVRAQVENFQQENYCRTLFYGTMIALLATAVLWHIPSRDHWTARLYLALIAAAQLFTAYQHYRRGGGETVPGGASLPALVAFHRRALQRRRHFLLTLWYWKMLPLAMPLLVELVQGRSGRVAPLVTIACFALAWTAGRGQARRITLQLDELERLTAAGTS